MTYSTYAERSNLLIGNNYLYTNIDRDFNGNIEEILKFRQTANTIFYFMESHEVSRTSLFEIYTSNKDALYSTYINNIDILSSNKDIKKLLKLPMNEILWYIENNDENINDFDITFYRRLSVGKKHDTVLKCTIPFEKISGILTYLDKIENNNILYSDYEKNIFYSSINQDFVGKNIDKLNLSNYYIVNNNLENGHIISLLIPKSFMIEDKINILLIIIISVVIALLVIICASIYTSNSITKGLDRFISTLQNNDNLLLNKDEVNANPLDEVRFIEMRFISAIKQINQLHNDVLQDSKHISNLELELLQAKINPHLLYNSLSAIKWNALEREDYATVNLIESMTKYYRLALNKGNNVLTVRQEISMIEEYIKINEVSKSSEYVLNINIEEEIMECYVIKHLLQPFVENSILHAFDSKFIGEKNLGISAFFDNDFLVFELTDNGIGMSEEKASQLVSMEYTSSYGGYGIQNLIKRIKVYYGEECGLNIYSEQGQGTKIVIRILSIDKDELGNRLNYNTNYNR